MKRKESNREANYRKYETISLSTNTEGFFPPTNNLEKNRGDSSRDIQLDNLLNPAFYPKS